MSHNLEFAGAGSGDAEHGERWRRLPGRTGDADAPGEVAAEIVMAVGWTRSAVGRNGDVVRSGSPDCTQTGSASDRMNSEPWWDALRAALADTTLPTVGEGPQLRTVTLGDTKLIVERPAVGPPVVYLFPAPTPPAPGSADLLTRRQQEVAELLVRGRSARQIAEELYISLATARSHIEHTYRRLGVNNRAQAVARLLDAPA